MTRARSAFSRPISPEPRRAAGAALLALLTGGCATGIPAGVSGEDPGNPVSAAQLLVASPLTAAGNPVLPADADVLDVDADMREFVAAHVDSSASADHRLRQLIAAVIGGGRFSIEYEDRTLTAAETFHRRAGNCLSFTNMFIALARAADLPVHFQEVDIPPDWTRSGDSLVLNRHIDALIRGADGRERVVDFDIEDFRTSYDHRAISDARAFAHYHSNLGVERMQAGDTGTALAHFRKAIGHDAGFAPAWINLGTLYLRAGHDDWAAAAWQHALTLSPAENVALSNLERLYRQRGQIEVADDLDQRIRRHRLQNPYFRYFLAQQAFGAGDYAGAIGHLQFAIGRKPNEDRFYALLGMSYLRSGDGRAARRWMARAAEVAGDEELQRRYHSKLELLQRAGTG